MEPITIAATLIAYATPYLLKVGESATQKIGEEVFLFVKEKIFKTSAETADEKSNIYDKQKILELETQIAQALDQDNDLISQSQKFIQNVQRQQTNMIVNQYGEKSISISHNQGDITIS